MNHTRPHLIDDFDDLDTLEFDHTGLDRERRTMLVVGACEVMRQHGYPIPPRYGPICEAFIEGEIDFYELSRRINSPGLN